jgi:signal transduction histidine kinase
VTKQDRPPQPRQASAPDPADRDDATSGRRSHHHGDQQTGDRDRAVSRSRPHGTLRGQVPPRGISNWRLRQKLAAVLVLPVLATLVFAGIAIRSEITNVYQFTTVLDELALGRQAALVANALEHERDAAVVVAASNKTAGATAYRQAADATDAAEASWQTLVGQDTDINSGVQTAVTAGLETVDGLGAVRSSVLGTEYPATAALSEYDGIIASTIAVNRAVAADATAAGTTPQAASLYLLALEDLSQQDSILLIMAELPTQSAALATDLNSATTAYTTDSATFNSVATPQQQQQVQDTVSGPDVDSRASDVQAALAEATTGDPVTVTASDIQPAATTTSALAWQVEQSLLDQVHSTLEGLKTSAFQDLTRDIIAVVVITLGVLAIMLRISAAMVRPLRILRTSALELARNTLPAEVEAILASGDPIAASEDAIDPIPPFTEEEVGDVARSFDEVHSQAVRLAAEQAVLRDNVNAIFVNLARRSQLLVERQLSLIDRLERDEQDPDTLGNLFELDHLATRMRRNSESLLVLSGNGLAKRMSHSVPIGDLVGAAVSEVEHYARIDVGSPPNVQIFGRVVNDVIHLVAELLDNATAFSEPNTKVSVRIAKTRSHEVAIQITDRGLGMGDEQIGELNERLAEPPELDPQVTRQMGLYVVAQIAKQHNIRVKLRTNEDIDGGTVALVAIPENLVVPPSPPDNSVLRARASFPPAPDRPTIAPGRTDLPAVWGPAEQPDTRQRPALAAGGRAAVGVSAEPRAAEPSLPTGLALWQPHIAPEPHSPVVRTVASAASQRPAVPPEAAEEEVVTARLPIYDEVLSKWFRPDGSEPAVDNEALSEPIAASTTGPPPGSTPAPVTAGPLTLAGCAASATPSQVPADVTVEPQTLAAQTATQDQDWRSPGDEGWQRAETLLAPVGEVTNAGLPRRVPQARLMPGSPSTQVQAPVTAATPTTREAPTARSAEVIRRRMNSFQRGVRRGRHTMADAATRPPVASHGANYPEEHP